MATYGPPRELTIEPAGSAVRHFLLHLGEMLLAMFVGMALFGSLFSAILVAAGTTYSEALEAVPELIALALMVEMTAPMVLWMRHRGHSAARIAEMAGAMLAVGVAAILLLWSSDHACLAGAGLRTRNSAGSTSGTSTSPRQHQRRSSDDGEAGARKVGLGPWLRDELLAWRLRLAA
jgi:hypothetical protein